MRKADGVPFLPEKQKPVLCMSVCTGEKVFGFRDIATGHVTEVACVRSEREYQALLARYGLRAEDVKREW